MKKIFLALSLVSSLALAEEPKRPLSIGFGIGPTYGAGFVFRYEWEAWGVQGSVLPMYTTDNALFVEGLTGFYTLDKGKYGRLYLSGGAAVYNKMSTTTIWPQPVEATDPSVVIPPAVPVVTRSWSSGVAAGPGVGVQFGFADNFVFSFDVPVAVMFDTSVKLRFDAIRPYPNAALLYNF
jgi:hypothetical protein